MNTDAYRLCIVSNITLEPFWPAGTQQIERTYFVPAEDVKTAGDIIRSSDIVAVVLHFTTQFPDYDSGNEVRESHVNHINEILDACKSFYWLLRTYTGGKIIWCGYECEDMPHFNVCGASFSLPGLIDAINIGLRAMLTGTDTFIDMRHLIARLGTAAAYDRKNKYRWNAPYSKSFLDLLVCEIHKQYCISRGITKKCLVLDCDGVLWGGILSEDGIEGILLGNEGPGRQHRDFQRFCLWLCRHGVILALCSKNYESDVLRVFREHSGMILREEHIACFQINWDNKAENIRRIADALRIGLDSMVFVDDSPFEIRAIESLLPEVTAVIFHRDTIYDALSCFNICESADPTQAEMRNRTYKTDALREQLRKNMTDSGASYESYLQALKMQVNIHIAAEAELARIAELSQRTNKCTNGIRYTVSELKRLTQNSKLSDYAERMETDGNEKSVGNKENKKDEKNEGNEEGSGYKLYAVTVSDRFSDLGIVGALGIYGNNLDLFSLSCRALGRNIEQKMLEFLCMHGINSFRFESTHKNDELHRILQEEIMKLIY